MSDTYEVARIVGRLDELEVSVDEVKKEVNDLRMHEAVAVVHRENVEKRLLSIEAILSRLTWLLITALGLAAVSFIIRGGLSSVPLN